MIEVEELGIENFSHIAFQFDILELNTNVKPTFLNYLLERKNVDNLFYLDPDIFVYDSFDFLNSYLGSHDIVLTPHCLSPIDDAYLPSEQEFLVSGVFNLGFVGVRNSAEGLRFLNWWEKRCLSLGFNEPRTGLFVDQKWVNLVPCFFGSTHIVRDAGCNVAYWNLHERYLNTDTEGAVSVNSKEPLIFFHFSRVSIENRKQLSKYQNRFDLDARPDLKRLFDDYRDEVISHGYNEYRKLGYFYSRFSNGAFISPFARRIFSIFSEKYKQENPFDAEGPFYRQLASARLLSQSDSSAKVNALTLDQNDFKVRGVNFLLRMLLRILGVDRYCMLMKYLSFITLLRHQKAVLNDLF